MTPSEMQNLLQRNPGWSALEALEQCFGIAPLDEQIEQAKSGGLWDQQTIKSIPEQVRVIRSLFATRYSGIVLSNEQIHCSILLIPYHAKRMIGRSLASVIKDQKLSQATQDWLDMVCFAPPHPVLTLYREVLGREPDPEGLTFWMRQIDQGMPVPVARVAFERILADDMRQVSA